MSVEQIKPGYKRTEVGVIPEDWSIRTIDCEVERLEAGVSVNSVDETLQVFPHEQSILKTSAVANGEFFAHEAKKIAPKDIHRARLTPKADSIIVSRMNTPDLVGECGYVAQDYPDLFLPDRLWMTKPRLGSNLCTRWLAFLLSSEQYKRRLKGTATGTSGSMKNLSKDAFLSLLIPFPAAAEQRAIAAALSDVDALLAKLDQLIAKKRDLKQATMQQLLTGKTRLPGFSGEWVVKRLGDICNLEMGRTPSRINQSYWGQGYKWLSIADLKTKVIQESSEEVTELAAKEMRIVSKGTLLMSFKLSIGRLAFAGCDLFTNEAICSFNNLQANANYLYYALGRVDFSLYGKQAVKGYTLNKASLKTVELSLPPTDEQTAIANALSDLDAELAALEHRRAKTIEVKQGMMKELLTGRIRLI